MTEIIKAKLILEDDSEFSGYSFGFWGNVNGEVACLGDDFNEAFLKSMLSKGKKIPQKAGMSITNS